MTAISWLREASGFMRGWLFVGVAFSALAGFSWGQESDTPPPPPRRPRDLPEDRLTTSLEFQELRHRRSLTRAESPAKLEGRKGADIEDLRVSPKVLDEMSKARVALKENKVDRALSHMKKAVEIDPSYSKAWNNLGLLYQSMGRAAEAEAALGRAVQANPENATAWKNLGCLLLASGRAENSLESLRAAANLSPDDPVAAAFLGEAMFQAGRFDEAATALERARTLRPEYIPVIYRLGCVYARQQRYPEALALLQKVLGSEHPGVDQSGVRKIVNELRAAVR